MPRGGRAQRRCCFGYTDLLLHTKCLQRGSMCSLRAGHGTANSVQPIQPAAHAQRHPPTPSMLLLHLARAFAPSSCLHSLMPLSQLLRYCCSCEQVGRSSGVSYRTYQGLSTGGWLVVGPCVPATLARYHIHSMERHIEPATQLQMPRPCPQHPSAGCFPVR